VNGIGPRLRRFARRPVGEATGAAGELALGMIAGVGLGVRASSFDACSENEMGEGDMQTYLATLSLPTASASLFAAVAYLRRLNELPLMLLALTLLQLRVLRLELAGSRMPRRQRLWAWTNLNRLGEGEEAGRPSRRNLDDSGGSRGRGDDGGSEMTTSIACQASS